MYGDNSKLNRFSN